MKKLSILTLCLGAAIAMPAQVSVLKEAERAQKGKQPAAEVVKIITPAFTDPETATMAQTWYIPGKAMFEEYDDFFAKKQFGKLPEGGDATMTKDLLQGYNYMVKALPLDSVTDAKGKVKTKYSKDIVNTIAGHYSDFNNAAIQMWELKDFKGAYDAWDIFIKLPQTAPFAKEVAKAVPADTTMAEVMYNQALAAWQADELQLALDAFMNAKAKGYNKKNLYDYAIAVASNLKNDDAVFELASEAQPLYGAEDPNYVGFMINKYLNDKDWDKAFSIIDEAIKVDPNNAQYYVVKGILYDNQKNTAEAKQMFKKAIELNGQNDAALFNYGRSLCEEAYALSDKAPTNPAEGEVYFKQNIQPLFTEAAQYLEDAWNVNNDNTDALRYLENVYYNLGNEAMLKDVQSRMGK